MPRFSYTGIAGDGSTVEGTTRAQTSSAARTALLERDVVVVTVEEKKSSLNVEVTKRKIKTTELMAFSRQLAAFLRAGIPILDAIHIVQEETRDKALRTALTDTVEALRGGDRLSAGIEKHAVRFPPFYIEMVKAAEVTGSLDEVLDQLSGYLERDLDAKRKIRSALAYPMVVFGMSVVTVAVIAGFVLPRFKDFFESLGAELPLPTRMLLAATGFITTWWWALIGGFVLFMLILFLLGRTGPGRLTKDRLKFRIPLVGTILRYVLVERVCRMGASMVRAGVPLPRAIELIADTTKNVLFERGLRQVRDEMLEGNGLARPMARTELFPSAVTQMIRVGEDTGTLEQQMQVAADFYDRELTYKIQKLTTYFEPAVIIFMGLVVGFVAIAMISAMYGIFRQAGNLG